jgi:hypothetical protein
VTAGLKSAPAAELDMCSGQDQLFFPSVILILISTSAPAAELVISSGQDQLFFHSAILIAR